MCFCFTVNDASGRYSSGLFYGNNFWMGSLTLCESIYKPPSDITPVVVVPAGNYQYHNISIRSIDLLFNLECILIGRFRFSAKSKRRNFVQWLQSNGDRTWKSTIFTRILCDQSENQWNTNSQTCKFIRPIKIWFNTLLRVTVIASENNKKKLICFFRPEQFEREFVYHRHVH